MSFVPTQAFASAAGYYARYRTRYPPGQVADLARRLGIGRSHTVADIGCGTGQLSIDLARFAGHIVAIDPVDRMLSLGQQAAAAAGLTNITWSRGDSEHLDRLIPAGTSVATFAASFHWMDRLAVAKSLNDLLSPNGAIVTLNDVLEDHEQPEWARAADTIRRDYVSDSHELAVQTFTRPELDHRSVLSASPFCAIERVVWEWERRLTVEEVVGLQFTYSVSTPAVLGDRAEQFARAVRAAVTACQPDNRFVEPFRVEVLIARRTPRGFEDELRS